MTSDEQKTTQAEKNAANEAHLAAHTAFLRRASVPVFIGMLIIAIVFLLKGERVIGLSAFLLGTLIAAGWRHPGLVPSEEEEPFFINNDDWDLPIDDPRNGYGVTNPISPNSYQWQIDHQRDIDANLIPPTDPTY